MIDAYFPMKSLLPKPAAQKEARPLPKPETVTLVKPADTATHLIGFDDKRCQTVRLEQLRCGQVFEFDDGLRFQSLRNVQDHGASVEVLVLPVHRRTT